jgi:hypothetical protein
MKKRSYSVVSSGIIYRNRAQKKEDSDEFKLEQLFFKVPAK